MNETAQQNMENHPVIRTLYDHVDEVTCLAFHPTEQILASGSRDYTLKLFDYSKPSAKRAFKYIQVRNVWNGQARGPEFKHKNLKQKKVEIKEIFGRELYILIQ